MKITRRSFLKSAMGVLASSVPMVSIAQGLAKEGKAVREFRFSASPARVNLGRGPDFIAWTYNGQVPGPEIRVKEGEIIRLILKNFLPEGTTIHWHGLPVPNSMDGVPDITQKAVMPGETFVYEFEAKPAGSYIYHSHAHYQLDQGLYGPLIIEPGRFHAPYDREYTLTLEDWVMKDGGGTARTPRRPARGMMMGGMRGRFRGPQAGPGPLPEPYYDGYAVNGRLAPEVKPIEVRKGERVKLRILNPSSATLYDLSLAGHTLKVTHADGNPILPVDTDVLRIGMGERYDVEFQADNPGSWLLAARETGLGEGTLRIPVQYHGIEKRRAIPPLFHNGLRFARYWDLKAPLDSKTADSDPQRAIFYPQMLSGGMHSPFWMINGRVHPNSERLVVQKGERVRLQYQNRSMMPHPMHLHGHFFKVVNPWLSAKQWILKDTVIVDPMQQIEIEFLADNPGQWFHHCHNLYHMEAGMANVVVYQE